MKNQSLLLILFCGVGIGFMRPALAEPLFTLDPACVKSARDALTACLKNTKDEEACTGSFQARENACYEIAIGKIAVGIPPLKAAAIAALQVYRASANARLGAWAATSCPIGPRNGEACRDAADAKLVGEMNILQGKLSRQLDDLIVRFLRRR